MVEFIISTVAECKLAYPTSYPDVRILDPPTSRFV